MATVRGDLLTPTLQGHVPRDWRGRLPWRLESQVYPAILGGPAAATLVALVNARRLRIDARTVALMAVGGVLLTALGLGAVAAFDSDAMRLLIGAAGLAAYGAFYLVQRAPDRVHSTFSPHDDPEEDYESLLPLGVAAVVVGLVAIAVLGAGA